MALGVTVILTGGTISMVPTNCGLAPDDAVVEDFFLRDKEIGLALPRLCRMIPYIDSSHASVEFWSNLADKIVNIWGSSGDGVVVVMGTDTMAYVGSALAMALGDCRAPVVITGASVPLALGTPDNPSDGANNLRQAVALAGSMREQRRGVWLLMSNQVFPAVRVSKHGRYPGFEELRGSPFVCPYLDVGLRFPCPDDTVQQWPDLLEWCNPAAVVWSGDSMRDKAGETCLRYSLDFSLRLLVITLVPSGQADFFASLAALPIETLPHAIIVRCPGVLGGPPVGSVMAQAWEKLSRRGVLLLAMSQGAYVVASPGGYASDQALINDIGAIPAGDHTLEALCAKLHFLSDRAGDKDSRLAWCDFVRNGMMRNWRGEVDPKTMQMDLMS